MTRFTVLSICLICVALPQFAANAYELNFQCDSEGNILSKTTHGENISPDFESNLKKAVTLLSRVIAKIDDINGAGTGCSPLTDKEPATGVLPLVTVSNSRSRFWSTRLQNPKTL